ncbi:MAG: malto-oligosyltrehalose trehalohydrolase [Cyanobacteria bacterium P01_A01_bin.114]
MRLGANYLSDGRCEFTVWAPHLEKVELHLTATDLSQNLHPMTRDRRGYWQVALDDIQPGARYRYRLDEDKSWPDPASYHQPEGVHGASAVVDHGSFEWRDLSWQNLALADYIIYELHIGTFTPAGTFEAAIERLDYLKTLGITAVEIMPVAQFPGERNWGYDGVCPFAVQQSYGGPDGLKQLVDACHQRGLAVILDVVYNHFGPEGNYTGLYGPYTTERYRTPWGTAINFDDAFSDGVRHYFLSNALYWFELYHIDALRLDAIHAIYDFGAKHFLSELAEVTAALGQSLDRPLYLIAESDLNDVRIIRDAQRGGYGLDAQWSDDFHHALHTALTKETSGYYGDFKDPESLAQAYRDSFVYGWRYSPFRQRYHGSRADGHPAQQFVVCAQNHDQVGNRMLGERLSELIPFEALKLAAGATLLSPYLPMLFMGEEYGETAPFLYFVDHGDPDLIAGVRAGRKREFEAFHGVGEPPDAASLETFERAKLNWSLLGQTQHKALLKFYQRLIALRKQLQIPTQWSRSDMTVLQTANVVQIHCWNTDQQRLSVMNFSEDSATVKLESIFKHQQLAWQRQIDSAELTWAGLGATAPDVLPDNLPDPEIVLAPYNFVLYQPA